MSGRLPQTHYERFHGFVVIHGTDTMAFAAAALAFALENLQKTVVLTGAQVTAFPRPRARSALSGPGATWATVPPLLLPRYTCRVSCRAGCPRDPRPGWQWCGPCGWQEARRNPPVWGAAGAAEGRGRAGPVASAGAVLGGQGPQTPLPQPELPGPPPRAAALAPCAPQVPIHALWSDGRENLLGALLMAGQYVIPEVPPPPPGGRGQGSEGCPHL